MNIIQVKQWFDTTFKTTKLYKDMEAMVEGSPYHREDNVAVHTCMVVDQYISMVENETPRDVLGLYACIFHDVGKPSSVDYKHNETRGDYKSFAGHEQKSARLFENYAMQHLTDVLTVNDIYIIGWMIEYHLPWSIKNPSKRQMMINTVCAYSVEKVFVNVLMADQKGRIADSPQKVIEAQEWCDQFVEMCETAKQVLNYTHVYDKVLFVAIGCSGSGKSTTYRKLSEKLEVQSFSLDALRHEWYGENYETAWAASVEDSQFSNKANARFNEMLGRCSHLYVDNTNTSKKSRRQYIDMARKKGFCIHAIYLPCRIETVLSRQQTRHDKTVPDQAVLRQYFSIQLPSYGEFDVIEVSPNNVLLS